MKLAIKSVCSYLFLAIALGSILGCDNVEQQKIKTLNYFAENGYGEGVAVVQHPAGEYRDGITYVAYQGPKEDPYVAAYNHTENSWYGPFKAGISILGKDPAKKIDSHGKPTLIIDDAGYIHIFYGGHGGLKELHGMNSLGDYHSGENKHAVSKRPFDISEWEDLDNVSPFGTYNQALKMDNGDIYLFFRHGAHRSDWVYQKSTDNGRNFEAPVAFLKHKERTDSPHTDSWYAYVSKGLGDEIVVGYDYHYCWNRGAPRNDRGGHSTERKNLYFMKFDTASNLWSNVNGEPLSIPITKDVADNKTLAINTDEMWTFNGTTKVDNQGKPHMSAYVGEDIGWQIGGPKHARYFRWTGERWAGSFDSGLPIGRGDFILTEHSVRYLVSGVVPNSKTTSVAWWESSDGGQTFSKGDELLSFGEYSVKSEHSGRPKSLSNLDSPGSAASSFIRNAHPNARIIIAEKPDGTDYRRMYLVGDKGPIQRTYVVDSKSQD